jgi:hypothetical protein
MNATRPIPGYRDSFNNVGKADERMISFLKRARHRNPKIIQAVVWAITDNFSADDIQRAYITVIRSTFRTRRKPAISWLQILVAKRILDKLKIRNRL